jgi:hypothetical protein
MTLERITGYQILQGSLIFWFLWIQSIGDARACLALSLESANERDAEVVIEGRLLEFREGQSDASSSLVLKTLKTIRGEHRESWTVELRGTRRPRTLNDFVGRFGREFEVGIMFHEARQKLATVVDNVCKMNRDDWFIRPIRSYRVLDVTVDKITSSAAAGYHAEILQRVTRDLGLVEGCYRDRISHIGRRLVQVRVTTTGPGQYVESRILKSDITDQEFQRCVLDIMQATMIPWTSQDLEERVNTDITYALKVCKTDSRRICS